MDEIIISPTVLVKSTTPKLVSYGWYYRPYVSKLSAVCMATDVIMASGFRLFNYHIVLLLWRFITLKKTN